MPEVLINSLDGSCFRGYASLPANNRGPGLIVVHDFHGINSSIRSFCHGFSQAGYIAVCPALFWRHNNAEQTPLTGPGKISAFPFKEFDIAAGERSLLATLAYLRGAHGCSGKIGVLGYGLGGKLAWLMAAHSDVDCVVIYYGMGLEEVLDEVREISCPVMLHLAENDKFSSSLIRKKIVSVTKHYDNISAFVYPGAEYGFVMPEDAGFCSEAASVSTLRTKDFLSEILLRN